MIDPFGRSITYLRLSVTDRCNLRCTYCMPERMTFVPRADLLTIDELADLSRRFITKGIKRLRLTGGEPLVRPGILDLIASLSTELTSGRLDELTLTTNGTLLAVKASDLARLGVKRINVSLDTLDPDRFRRLTRGGDLVPVLKGVDAAIEAGLSVKINAVALQETIDEAADLAAWAHGKGAAISFIEVMPLGDVEQERLHQHIAMPAVRALLEQRFTLTDTIYRTGGPARYVRTGTGGLIGFITPLSHNFCGSCNRVRVTATGRLHACLGFDAGTDLRGLLRAGDDEGLDRAIARAVGAKPEAHDFRIAASGSSGPRRHMSITGG